MSKKSTNNLKKPSHIVGIGASAGGLEAIQAFFKNVQKDTGLAYVVVQHLSPDYKSLMVELMEKITDLPVQRAEDGMIVEADSIYLIPPKKNLRIFHGTLLLEDQERSNQKINLPIDIFLTSLAEDYTNKAIAIILSGAGSDGTRGCRAVKEAGGMVMVQDEASAKFDAMPRSVANAGFPDSILPPEGMPRQLTAFINHPYANRKSSEPALIEDQTGITRIFSLLREKSKIDFTFYKPSTIIRRIERRMSVNQTENLQDYVTYLERNPKEQNTLYREMLIGVTNFFRDPEVFNLLEENWLPKKLEEYLGDEFRIWIAGCSTGEEAYSYAMLCREIMDRRGISKNVKIFATDVDQDALSRASTGVYSESITADIPNELLSKYFIRQGEEFRIIRQIREMVVFARHNLIKDPPFTNIELVSCRNLMIYFQPILQTRVLESMNFSLRSEGLLVLGSSESLGEAKSYFETLNSKWNIYQSLGHRKPLISSDHFTPRGLYKSSVQSRQFENSSSQQIFEEERILARFTDALANDIIPFAMVIDENMMMKYVVGDGRNYLNPPSGKVVNDIAKVVNRDLAIPISTGISKVFSSRNEVSFTNVRININQTERKSVNIRIKLLPEQRGKGQLTAVFITEVSEATAEINRTHDLDKSVETFDLSHEAEQRINDLEQELQFTRENLQASVEELETSNEELQATNEELLASNEELQSTNEELQSVNEELFTVNAEHQSKISELIELNNDLDNFVNSTTIVSVFLDENLDIRRFTSNASQLFNILEHDTGRPFAHISHRFPDLNLLDLVEEVNKSGKVYKAEVQSHDGVWYQLRLQPYMVSERTQSGLVIVLSDIDEIKHLQNDLSVSMQRYDLAQESASIGVWEWNILDDTLLWSDGIEPMFGMEKGAFNDTFDAFKERVHPDDRDELTRSLEKAIKNKTTYQLEHRVLWPDGETVIWVNETGRIEYNEHNKPIKMVGLVREITDRKAVESDLRNAMETLHENKTLLENVISLAPTGLGLTRNRIISWVSPIIENISGYSMDELIGQNTRMLYNTKEEFDLVTDMKNSEAVKDGEYTISTKWKKKNGDLVDIIFSSKSLDDADGNEIVVFSVHDANKIIKECPMRQEPCPLV